MAETAWVLERAYGLPDGEIAAAIPRWRRSSVPSLFLPPPKVKRGRELVSAFSGTIAMFATT
jgi:hypothetical protein